MSQKKLEYRLTFGVELEHFLLYINPYGNRTDPHPNDPRPTNRESFAHEEAGVLYDVAQRLTDAGLPAWSFFGHEERLTDAEKRERWEVSRDSHWYFKDDYDAVSLEIKSPPFYYDESAISAVEQVLTVLRKHYRVTCNTDTGLHVHIGNGYDGFQFSKVRNMLAMVAAFERQWFFMLPEHRINNGFCQPLNFCHLGRDITQRNGPRLEFLNRIIRFRDFDELQYQMMNRGGFNLLNHALPWDSTTKRTLEIRHHEGTLDHVAIKNWIYVCIKFVEKALFVGDKPEEQKAFHNELRRVCELSFTQGNNRVSTVKFLMWLGCPVQAYYYGKMIQQLGDNGRHTRLEAINARLTFRTSSRSQT